MAVQDGWLVGGYTLLYLRSRMNRRQRAKLDASTPFRLADDEPRSAAA